MVDRWKITVESRYYFNVVIITIIRAIYKHVYLFRVAFRVTNAESHSLIVSLNFKYGTN